MKKLVALALSLVMIVSMIPANVFAVEESADSGYYIKDTFVYDFMRNEDGIFDELVLQFVTYDEGGTPCTWVPERFPTNTTIPTTMMGDLTLSDTQYTARWEVGNTYPVSYGDGQTFNVEVRPSHIDRIEINDCSFCVYNEAAGKYEYSPTCTIYYKDGGEEVSRGISIEYYGHWDAYSASLELEDNQEAEPWVLGGTYEVTGTLAGFTDTFQVNVVCAEAISVAPIYKLEGSGWMTNSWNPETQTYEDWMNYSYFPKNITITLSDGSYATGSPYSLDGSIEYFLSWSAEQSYQNQWGVGEHTATIRLGDLTAEYQVIIQENPVESVDIHDISVVENSFGWMESDFFYYDLEPIATITLKDGTVIEDYYLELGEEKYWIEWDSYGYQYTEHWTVGNSYTITGSLLGISDTFTVTIADSPVESIQIEDTSVMAYADGWDNGEFFYYDPEITATITLKDGTVLHQNYLELDGGSIGIDVNLDIQYEQPWTEGNTYTVTGSLLGVTDTFQVTVTGRPVESIEIENVSIMEYSGGYFYDEFYFYEPDVTATITLKDGTVITGGYLELDDTYYHIDVDTSVQYNEPWTAGNTYTVTGTLLGVSDTFEVTILESPVESIEIEDITFIEGEGSYWFDEDYCFYYVNTVNAQVTMKDGTVETITDGWGIQIGGEWYYLELDSSSQHDTPWTAGNTYTATGSLLGVTDTFNVTILPTPVESITVADMVLFKGIDSYSYGNYDEYYFTPVLEDVVLKDGTRPEILDDGIIYEDEYYGLSNNTWYVQCEEPWTPGNTYQVTGYLLGVKTTFNVTIQEDPIRELELVKAPEQRECLTGVYPNLKGATIRIHYTDGTYEDVVFSDDYTAGYYRTFFSEKLNRRTDVDTVSAFETAGQQTAELELFGHTCQIPYTVKENKMQELILTENADKSVTISVRNSDGTSFDMKILDLCFVWEMEENQYYGGMFTDIGLFECAILADDSSFTLALWTGGENAVISNTIGASEWFEVMVYMQDHPLYFMTDYENVPKNYSGVITADNIDVIIEMAGIMDGIFYTGSAVEDTDGNYYDLVSGTQVISAVKKFFAVENVDLSLSEYYDPQTGTYKHIHYLMGAGQVTTACPDQVSYKNGVWTITSIVEEYSAEAQTVRVSLDAQGRIKSYTIGNMSIFKDVTSSGWQFDAALYAYENNLMAGKGTDQYGRVIFDPNSPITREEFVQVLYNAEGKPSVSSDKDFTDVKNEWYKNAVLWAYEAGVASGFGNGSFGVGKNITRQDLAVMLYKYAKIKGYDLTATEGKIDAYADGSQVSDYAKEAMNWAVTNGVLSGKGNAGEPISTFRLDPTGTATRAECAAMLRNFMEAFGL